MDRPKSLNAEDRAHVRFINNSSRNAVLIWLDYNGDGVRFTTLKSGQFQDIKTFKTHPWICVDEHTGVRFLLNGHKVFYPVGIREAMHQLQHVRVPLALINNFRTNVAITLPMFSLRNLSMHVVLMHLKSVEDLNELRIARTLKNDLVLMNSEKKSYFRTLKSAN